MKLSSRFKLSGEGLVVVFIVLAIVAGIWWYLYSTRATTEREARQYGHEIITRLAVDHDISVMNDELNPDLRSKNPPSAREYMIQRFTQLGVPQQPIQIDDNITFDSYFFSPHGFFTAHLNYPGQGLLLQVAISHPVAKWQIDDITGPAPAPH